MAKKFLHLVGVMGIVILSFMGIQTFAFEAEAENSVVINEQKSNLHVAGNSVTINEDVSRDLYAAGNNVVVNANVERNLIVGGNTVTVNGDVGGTIRIAGNTVTLSGNFDDDVIVFAGVTNLSDAIITGDLVVFTDTLELENVIVNEDFTGAYSTSSGDAVNDVVAGEVDRLDVDFDEYEKDDDDEEEQTSNSIAGWIGFILYKEIAAILVLLILFIFLKRRNRLHIPSLKFDMGLLKALGIGAIVVFVMPVILLLFTPFFPTVVLPLAIILISLFIVSSTFLPIFAANIIKNSFAQNTSIAPLVWWSYLGLVVFGLAFPIPFVGQLLGLLVFVLTLANFGFILHKLLSAITTYLSPRKKK